MAFGIWTHNGLGIELDTVVYSASDLTAHKRDLRAMGFEPAEIKTHEATESAIYEIDAIAQEKNCTLSRAIKTQADQEKIANGLTARRLESGNYRLINSDGAWIGPNLGIFENTERAILWADKNGYHVKAVMNLDLDFMATYKGGLAALRAKCAKELARYKSPQNKAHYQAIIDAIDLRESVKCLK